MKRVALGLTVFVLIMLSWWSGWYFQPRVCRSTTLVKSLDIHTQAGQVDVPHCWDAFSEPLTVMALKKHVEKFEESVEKAARLSMALGINPVELSVTLDTVNPETFQIQDGSITIGRRLFESEYWVLKSALAHFLSLERMTVRQDLLMDVILVATGYASDISHSGRFVITDSQLCEDWPPISYLKECSQSSKSKNINEWSLRHRILTEVKKWSSAQSPTNVVDHINKWLASEWFLQASDIHSYSQRELAFSNWLEALSIPMTVGAPKLIAIEVDYVKQISPMLHLLQKQTGYEMIINNNDVWSPVGNPDIRWRQIDQTPEKVIWITCQSPTVGQLLKYQAVVESVFYIKYCRTQDLDLSEILLGRKEKFSLTHSNVEFIEYHLPSIKIALQWGLKTHDDISPLNFKVPFLRELFGFNRVQFEGGYAVPVGAVSVVKAYKLKATDSGLAAQLEDEN